MPHPTYVLVAILVLLGVFVHRRFVVAPRLPRRASRVLDALVIVMSLLAVIGYGSGDLFDPVWARLPGAIGLTWLAALLYLTLGALAIGALTLLIHLTGIVRGKDSSLMRQRVARVGSVTVAAATIAVVAFGVLSASSPKVSETVVSLDRLPAEFDGLRIALVADVHAGPTRDARFVEQVVREVNAQDPDLVILAGDLIDGTVALVGDTLAPLRDLRAPLGVFAVTGNHEYYSDGAAPWTQLWSELNVRVLENEHVKIGRDGASLVLAGITDATAPPPNSPDVAAALAGRDRDEFVLMIAHQPVQVLQAADFGVDLQVSGHTHGGQLWPLRYLVPLQQPSIEGLDRFGRTVLYTTRGAGAWGPPVRVGASPEISMLELTREDSVSSN